MWTPEFERFVAPARARPQLWRLLVGILVIGIVWMLATTGLFAATAFLVGVAEFEAWLLRLRNGASATGTTMLLYTFGGLVVGTMLAGLLHRRRPATLIGAAQGRPFLAGLVAVVLVNVLALAIPSDLPLGPGLEPQIFVTFLPVALVGVLLQTGAEEIAFRGYLQTQLAARFRTPVVWFAMPSIVFGALHYAPGEYGTNAYLVVLVTTLVGLIAADLTRVTGGIGAAWGLHFANNCAAILVVGSDNLLGGLSLFRASLDLADPALAPLIWLDLGLLVLAWGGLRLWFGRRQRTLA